MSKKLGKVFERFLVLNNGRHMPMVGLGCYGISNRSIIEDALENGYRHFDTANFQENETELGLEVHDFMFMNAFHRQDYFITSKVHSKDLDFERAYNSIDVSLEATKLGYIDNMLLLWPGSMHIDEGNPKNIANRHDAWRALEKGIEERKLAGAGVSNFNIHHLEKLMQASDMKPTVNQIEIHPLHCEDNLVEFCRENDIVVQGYAPFAGGDERLLNNVTLNAIADRNEVTVHQLILLWHLQKGFGVLPNSTKSHRQQANINLEGLQIPEQDIAEIDSIRKTQGQFKKYWDSKQIV